MLSRSVGFLPSLFSGGETDASFQERHAVVSTTHHPAWLVIVAVLGAIFAYLAMQWRSAKSFAEPFGRQYGLLRRLMPIFQAVLKSPASTHGLDRGYGSLLSLGRHFLETVRAVSFGNPNLDPNRPKATDDACYRSSRESEHVWILRGTYPRSVHGCTGFNSEANSHLENQS
jgi:hypothetical protein